MSPMDIRRHLLGICGLLFMAAWAAVVLSPANSDTLAFAAASSLRIGLVLCALWLSLPQLQQLSRRFPPWVFGVIGLLILVVAVRPKMIIYAAPILGALVVLQFMGKFTSRK